MHYTLTYGVLGSATAVFNAGPAKEMQDALHISCKMKTGSLTSLLFRVNNLYQSWINTKTWLPIKTQKAVEQTNIEQRFVTVYHFDSLLVRTSNNKSWALLPGCMDLFGFIYSLRCMDLKNADRVVLLDLESHIWSVYLNQDSVVHRLQSFETIKMKRIIATFEPAVPLFERTWKTDLLFNRLSRKNTNLTIYLGPPPACIPYLMEFINNDSMIRMKLNRDKSICDIAHQ